MKKIFAIIICTAAFACGEDEKITDNISEYVSFSGNNLITLGEADDEEVGYPLTVQLWAFNPYSEDITLTFEVSGTNAASGVDYLVSPDNQIMIRAGNLLSDTIWVKTVNGELGNELERTFNITLLSASQTDIKLGLGSLTQKNKTITFKITDDDCSGNPICVFNQTLVNTIGYTGGGNIINVTGVASKINNTVTLTGNLIDYETFSSASLTLTLVPESSGASSGIVTFGEQETGTDQDGYDYKFIQTGSGAYDANAGTIRVAYDIYYKDGGSWTYWYSVTNVFSLP